MQSESDHVIVSKMAAGIRQDRPPVGGYPEFQWARSLRNPPSFMKVFLGGLGVMTLGFAAVINSNRQRRLAYPVASLRQSVS